MRTCWRIRPGGSYPETAARLRTGRRGSCPWCWPRPGPCPEASPPSGSRTRSVARGGGRPESTSFVHQPSDIEEGCGGGASPYPERTCPGNALCRLYAKRYPLYLCQVLLWVARGEYTSRNEREDRLMKSLIERFLRYAKEETTSCESSESLPSTATQMRFLELLEEELVEMGVDDPYLCDKGTLYASLPPREGPTVGLLAHVDTSPDAPGAGVKPVLHRSWNGSPIELPSGDVIEPTQTKDMDRYRGSCIVTSNGSTLLGADDKAGVAVIMEICRHFLESPDAPRPDLRLAFTTDEEIGRGMDGFDVERFGVDFAYTVDGGPVGIVDTQTFNAWKALWTIVGREVHPGSAKGVMVNAVRIAGDLISMLRGDEMPESTSGMEGYVYPILVEGATREVRVKMLIRDFTVEGAERRLEQLEEVASFLRAAYPGSRIELDTTNQYLNPGEVVRNDPRIVDCAMRGTRAAGLEPVEGAIRGGTDGSRLSRMGVPTVNLPTGGEMFHSRTEWISDRGLELSYLTVAETLRAWSEKR
ncbi:peptidase T [Candidatus Fermentibacteria bacterium]|nr:peptidase T [Candidatus Fermentibacteria bacterium]